MTEFEEIKKFLCDDCNLNVIDITDKLTMKSYSYHCDIAKKNPNNVYISKRTIKNNDLFKAIASFTTDETHEQKYMLIKNDNYHITSRFSKAAISKFATGTDEEIYTCGICYNTSLVNSICKNCTFTICGYCITKLLFSNNLKCPQCRTQFEIYDNMELTEMKRKYSEEYKLKNSNF